MVLRDSVSAEDVLGRFIYCGVLIFSKCLLRFVLLELGQCCILSSASEVLT